MEVIGLQWDLAWENRPANFRRARHLIEKARPPKEALVVMPEMFSSGFSMNVAEIAEREERLAEAFLKEIATAYGVFVTAGVVNVGEDGLGRNESVTYGPSGACRARYVKMHPFLKSKEGKHFRPGSEAIDWDWNGARTVPLICYDLRFPEIFRIGARRGADVFVVIACWPEARREHWKALLRARAIENQAYVIGVNRVGADPYLGYSGWSCIFDFFGNPVAEAGEGEEIVRAAINLPGLREYRRSFPFLEDIRPDLFP